VLSRALSVRRLQAENTRLRETLSIYELARAITRGLEHDEIVQRTLAAAMQQHDAGVVCILVPTADSRALRVAGSHGLDSSGPGSEPPALDRSMSEWVSSAREQLSTWDGSSPLPAVFEPPFAGSRRGVALPMVAGGNFYGILEFSSRAAQRRLSPGQVKALDILANTAASYFFGRRTLLNR
jgi:GAF domain-containing protein